MTPRTLPPLHNPLLNCLLNNPNHGKSPFRGTIEELARSPTDHILLIPPAAILHSWFDPASDEGKRVSLRHLCYTSEDFIQSHVVRVSSATASSPRAVSTIFATLNGKQLLVKNGVVIPGKGFKKSLRLNIVGYGYVPVFCGYLPRSVRLFCIYLDTTMFGASPPKLAVQATLPRDSSSPAPLRHDPPTFDRLLRHYPSLAQATSERFVALFHHNNPKYRVLSTYTKKPPQDIVDEFCAIRDEAYRIVSESASRAHDVLASVLATYPDLDLNRAVHEYVELNLYDKIWSQLLLQFPATSYRYSVSLAQLDMPQHPAWVMDQLQRRVVSAIAILNRIGDALSAAAKVTVFEDTVAALSSGTAIDADTLIGLLIMVVCHASSDHLDAHLYYVKHFAASPHDGNVDYILSNFDAVVYYISEHREVLADYSEANEHMWQTIKDGGTDWDQTTAASRTLDGDSSIAVAIKAGNQTALRKLLSSTAMGDLLFDRNVTKQTLLMVAIETGQCVSLLLAHIANLPQRQRELYINIADSHGRVVGHYLHHSIDLISSIGGLVDWNVKDNNGHTPLLSLCRCYDHPKYVELIAEAFECVNEKYGFIDFTHHVDKVENTLLHVLKAGLNESKMLNEIVNVNQPNCRGLTPLMIYLKYDRRENMARILQDSRIDVWYETPTFATAFDVSHTPELLEFARYSTNCKWDGEDWVIYFANGSSRSLSSLMQAMTAMHRRHGLPLISWFRPIPMITKFQVNRVLESVNVALEAVTNHPAKSMLLADVSALESTGVNGKTSPELSRLGKMPGMVTAKSQATVAASSISSTSAVSSSPTVTDVGHGWLVADDIESFLRFSLRELTEYLHAIVRVNQMVAITSIKHGEVAACVGRLLKFEISEGGSPRDTWKQWLNYTAWIESTATHLVEYGQRVLKKLQLWRRLHHDIAQLNGEIDQCEGAPKQEMYSVIPDPASLPEPPSSFFKRDPLRRLLYAKQAKVDQLTAVNADIRRHHEALAAEIAEFLQCRGQLLTKAVRHHTTSTLTSLRSRLVELQMLKVEGDPCVGI
ncbi:hypothetical protein DICA3_A09296 [Diutina catenulata]